MPFQWEYREAQTVAVALREFALAVGFEQQRQVSEARHSVLPAERTIQQDVQWSRGQPFLATDHVCDFHEVVVHDIGQVVSGQLVRTLVEHLVVQDSRVDLHVTTDHVVHVNIFAWLDFEAHHILCASGNQGLHLVGRHSERVAHLATSGCVVLEVFLFSTLSVQFLGSIECDVSLVLSQELVYIFFVDFAAFALAVWPLVASVTYAFVKLDAEPFEGFDDILFGTGHEALRVGVLDTEHHLAAVLTGKQVVVQCGANTTDMQWACGAGRKAHSDGSIFHKKSIFLFSIAKLLQRHRNTKL